MSARSGRARLASFVVVGWLCALAALAPRDACGQTLSLDFQRADVRSVLRLLGEIAGLNLVIDPDVSGQIDVRLTDVPWQQAFDVVLTSARLRATPDGLVVRVASQQRWLAEAAERGREAELLMASGERVLLTRTLSYARAADVMPILAKGALSPRGDVQVDARTNTLVVRDVPAHLAQVETLVATLDVPQAQVEIEARILQTSRDVARTLGVTWGLGRLPSTAIGAAATTGSALTGRIETTESGDAPPAAVALAADAPTSAIGVRLGSVPAIAGLDLAISAMERRGEGRVLSTPRVSTQNNVEAEITQGVQIPVQTQANNSIAVSFKDAALTLRVRPQITSAGTIIMRVVLENAAPDYSRSVNGIPPIDTQRAVTTVLVADGETTVIGGIATQRVQESTGRTPGLHRVPWLGRLFRRDDRSDDQRELLIFITPRITRSAGGAGSTPRQ
jgi:type IV pilus assembly protein PilQ